jgi:peroxiredoxin
MTLKQEIDAFVAQAATAMPQELLADIERSIEEVRASGILDRALHEGDLAPAFTLPNAGGRPVALKDVLRRGPAIVTFYRGVWCPYCNLELRAYQRLLPEIRAVGGDLIAISPQTPDNSERTASSNVIGFEVLSDHGNEVAAEFGIAYPTPDAVRRTTAMFGVDIDVINGVENSELPISATYVVGSDRRIVLASVEVDFRRRLEPAEALAALRALARQPAQTQA